jgi:poly-gamma-glutamate synthesis protein (capsule biosynthesis protein)
VRFVSINIREAENSTGKNAQRIREKIAGLETMLAQAHKPLAESAPSIVWICATGDLMLERDSGNILINEGAEGVMGKTAEYFKKSDLNLLNLEGAVSTRGVKSYKSFTFRFDPRTVPSLKTAGINAVLLANNHAFDYGETAFLDTLAYLEKDGIAALGGGRNIAAASAPLFFRRINLKYGFSGLLHFPLKEQAGTALCSTPPKIKRECSTQ